MQQEQYWALAEQEFRNAIALNPSNASAYWWYGMLLRVVNRFDEMFEKGRILAELDPLLKEDRQHWTPQIYCWIGGFPSAIASAQAARDRHPENPSHHIHLGLVYARAARMEEARKEAELSTGPVNEFDRPYRAILWSMLGKPEEARRLVADAEESARTAYVSTTDVAMVYAALGETERALDWLERDDPSGCGGFLFGVHQDSAWDPIRDDPRFRSMIARLNLPTEGKGARGAVERP